MNKKLSLIVLTCALALGAYGQSALDLRSRMTLHKSPASRAESALAYGFIKASEQTITELEGLGVEVLSRAGDIAVVQFPAANTEQIAANKGVRRMQLSRDVAPKLDKARALTGIDAIHSGLDLPRAYTGAGVVAGIVDAGMDPNHINFKNADGTSRIKSFAFRRYNSSYTAMLSSEYDAESVSQFTTDDDETYHGTHTMGIMAGGWQGNTRVAQATGSNGTIRLATVNNPYYGAATGADIAASCGTLQDAFIAYGVSGILDYAYSQGKPCVVNLSLGSNAGPHDGNCMLSQYLEAESQYATICISAGNEGDQPIHITKTFTEDDTELATFIHPSYFGADEGNMRYGSLDIYSDSETTFDVQGIVFNQSRGRVAERIAIAGNTEGAATYYVSSTDYGDGTISANFAKAFDGYCGVGSMIDEDTGRFYAILDYYTQDNQTTNADGNYLLGVLIKGQPGQRVDIYCDGSYTDLSNYGIAGYADGSCDGSISDMGTTRNCVVVGSYDSRDNWLSLDKAAYGYDGMFEPGTISEFSSYGTLLDGRTMPHVCAPGATIVSSTNSYFVNAYSLPMSYLQAVSASADLQNGYWEQMVGTSMATPLVAGAIALWLEADPTLSCSEVIEIIQQTAVVDNDVRTTGNAVQWGAGKFDAYAGLKEVLRRAGEDGVGAVAADGAAPAITDRGGKTFSVYTPGTTIISVCDTAGCTVATATAQGEATVDLSAAAPGIYIFTINNTYTQKLVVR